MKDSLSMLEELEASLMRDVNKLIFDIIGIKMEQQISEITRLCMKDIVQYHINDTSWINEIKQNIKNWILEYQMDMSEQSNQLNIRMDFLEQRQLDFMRKIETEYSKSVFAHIAGEL